MKRVILVILLGAIATCLFFLFRNIKPEYTAKVNRLLDQDTLHLTSGEIVRGWIAEENKTQIIINTGKTTRVFDRRTCERISKDTLSQYIQELL